MKKMTLKLIALLSVSLIISSSATEAKSGSRQKGFSPS
jgi:hypothetical protein